MPIPLGVLAVAGAGAAGGGNSFDLLETTVLGTDTTSVTFSGLGSYSAYKHLQIRLVARESVAADQGGVVVQFNADTGNNYYNHALEGNGSSVSSLGFDSTSIRTFSALGNTSTASAFGAGVLDILDFSSSSKRTTLRALTYGWYGYIYLSSGLWNNTAAITSIRLAGVYGGFKTGSRFSLYGIK